MKPLFRLVGVMTSMALSLVGCSSAPQLPTKTVKIGAMIDQASAGAADPAFLDALRLAATHVNAALKQSSSATTASLQFELVFADSANDPKVAVPRAQAQVNDEKVVGLISDGLAVPLDLNRLNYEADESLHLDVPMICTSCTTPSVNDPNYVTDAGAAIQDSYRDPENWLFRTQMINQPLMLVLVRAALARGNNGDVNGDGRFKVAMAHRVGLGRSSADDVKMYATQLYTGANPPIFESVRHPTNADANSYNFAADAVKLTDNTNADDPTDTYYPDLVVVVTLAGLQGAFARTFHEGNYAANNPNLLVLYDGGLRIRPVMTALGSFAEGARGVSALDPANDESGAKFVSDFMAAYTIRPPYNTSLFYDSAVTMMLAAIKAGVGRDDPSAITPTEVRDSLRKTSEEGGTVTRTGQAELKKAIDLIVAGKAINYEGTSGPVNYDAVGDVRRQGVLWEVKNGMITDTNVFDCISDTTKCLQVQ